MLDAYIIDRIRREREQRDGERAPLHIEVPSDPSVEPPHERPMDDERKDRGTTIVDYRLNV
jgi:hypothetical protein